MSLPTCSYFNSSAPLAIFPHVAGIPNSTGTPPAAQIPSFTAAAICLKCADPGELEGIFVSEYAVPGMPFLPLGEDELMLVVPQNHPLSEKKEVDIRELAEYEFILSSDGLDYETGHIFEENCITPDIRYQINEDYAVCKMVEQGFGVTILPKLLLHRIPFDVCILPFSEHYSRTLGLAYCGSKQPTLATLRFLEYIREESKHIIKENFR